MMTIVASKQIYGYMYHSVLFLDFIFQEEKAMEIRMLTEKDYEYIISVLNDWFGGRNMADQLPRLFVKHFADTCIVAEQDGELAGFVIGFVSQSKPDSAYIHFTSTNPAFRGQGIGRKLYDRFYQIVAEKECSKIYSVTSTVNQLSLKFHVGIGFSVMENDLKDDAGYSYFKDYDGVGDNKYLFEIQNPYLTK